MSKKAFIYVISISAVKKIVVCVILVAILLITCFSIKKFETRAVFNNYTTNYTIVMKRDLLCLMMAYWEYIKGVQRMPDDKVYLVMNSGNCIIYDDKKVKTYNEKIDDADLQDMMEQIYPLQSANYLRPLYFDPGRFRTYALFREVYGSTKDRIEENLVNIKFGNSNLQFNKNNDAAAELMEINREITLLTKTRRDIIPFVFPSSGTYNYRLIAGTNLLSAHSFGAAIDLAANKSDYWEWSSRSEGLKRMEIYPPEIVRIFEKHNFIWGGNWGHFDLMHYEYRPELILKAKYFSKMPSYGQNWYYGAPYSDNADVGNYIKLIDEVLK